MLEIFLRTVPFFMVIACGYGAAALRVFSGEAVAHLTKFVFYFALSAMLFSFTAGLPFERILNLPLAAAYLLGTGAVYVLVTVIALRRGTGVAEAAIEAQCGVIGNVGFLGLPMLSILIGERAVGPLLMMISVDLLVFGSLVVILIVASRGRFGPAVFAQVALGLVKNPMLVSMAAGLVWSALALPMPRFLEDFITLLGGAATPGALFAIGASLAGRSAERLSVAAWLSFAKLVLHPAAVGAVAIWGFGLPWELVGIMLAVAAMPTAGNVYIIAQHYGVAPMRASSTILISTAVSIVTLTAVIALVT